MGLSLGSSEMKVTVVSRSGKQLAVLDTLNPNSTIKEVQKELALSKASFPVERQRLTLQNKDDKARPVALDADKKLSDYGLTTDCTIIFKDLGPQISWRSHALCSITSRENTKPCSSIALEMAPCHCATSSRTPPIIGEMLSSALISSTALVTHHPPSSWLSSVWHSL